MLLIPRLARILQQLVALSLMSMLTLRHAQECPIQKSYSVLVRTEKNCFAGAKLFTISDDEKADLGQIQEALLPF